MIIFNVYRLYGVICFSAGIRLFTQGTVVFKRIKELLMLKDLECLEDSPKAKPSRHNLDLKGIEI